MTRSKFIFDNSIFLIIKLNFYCHYLIYFCFSRYSFPHSTIESNIVFKLQPVSDREYSTLDLQNKMIEVYDDINNVIEDALK